MSKKLSQTLFYLKTKSNLTSIQHKKNNDTYHSNLLTVHVRIKSNKEILLYRVSSWSLVLVSKMNPNVQMLLRVT